jgi:hypothetical protein
LLFVHELADAGQAPAKLIEMALVSSKKFCVSRPDPAVMGFEMCVCMQQKAAVSAATWPAVIMFRPSGVNNAASQHLTAHEMFFLW